MGYAAARPPMQIKNAYTPCVLLFTTAVFVWHACVFVLPMVWVFLFALNIYGNAQAGALLILHIARLV